LTLLDHYLDPAACEAHLEAVRAECARAPAPLVERPQPGRALRYRVLDGERVHAALPGLEALYGRVGQTVRERFGDTMVPLGDRRVRLNVNLTPPGGEYRWHYDRNAVTAILYLNAVQGGETEAYADYRLYLGRRPSRLQAGLDRLLRWGPVLRWAGRLERVAPQPGRLLLMRGERCLHSVRAVEGDQDRINVIMCFDRAGARYAQASHLDPYLYTQQAAPDFDPNYVGPPR
jgi:hypothetical protein